MREIRILPGVLEDVAETASWYDQIGNAGLGERFLNAFYAILPHLQREGEIYRTVYQDFRKVLIRPFPYTVYYRLHSDIWIVTLVIHAARNPDLHRKLLQSRR